MLVADEQVDGQQPGVVVSMQKHAFKPHLAQLANQLPKHQSSIPQQTNHQNSGRQTATACYS